MRNQLFFSALLMSGLFAACEDQVTSATETPATTEMAPAEREEESPAIANPYTINGDGVYGLNLGEPFSPAGGKLEKGTLRTGEGEFEVYYLREADGTHIGYAVPGYPDGSKIGSIMLTSPKFKDRKGIGVGSTFGDLRKAYPDIQASGSEIEARVYANRESYSYRLEMNAVQAELDEDEITASTKITEISIR